MNWIQNMNRCVGPVRWYRSELEQWHIDTYGLKVGGKLWRGAKGWYVIERLEPGIVFVRPDPNVPGHEGCNL